MTAKNRKRHINKAQSVTTGTNLRMEEASSDRKPKPNQAIMVVHEMNPVGGFVTFLREHAIVGLAVGFAIATQVQALVKQLIASFIDPLYGLFFAQKLSDKTVTLHWHDRAQIFDWGAFAYTMVDFIFVLIVIYVLIKSFNLDKWDKPKEKNKMTKQEQATQTELKKIEEIEIIRET